MIINDDWYTVINRNGVKRIAPYLSKKRCTQLDTKRHKGIKWRRSANLENGNNGMAKTPSTARKGVKPNG